MIERIQVTDYRSCHKTTFKLQPDLSVLIGPNGSGKTTVLNTFVLLRQLAASDPRYRDVETATDECQIKTWFRINEKQCALRANLKLFTETDNSNQIITSVQNWYTKEFTENARPWKFPIHLASIFFAETRPTRFWHDGQYDLTNLKTFPDSFKKPIVEIAEFLNDIKYYSASQFTNPSECPVSIEVEKQGKSSRPLASRRGHTRFLYDVYRAYKSPNQSEYKKFINVIGPSGIGLIDGIEFKEILTSSIDYRVRSGGTVRELKREKLLVIPQFRIGKNVLSPSQLSEGTFKTITLLFYVMTERSSALLIEEPEVCVHHGLLTSIMELIKTHSKKKQIIISTHSDFVLDQIDPTNVYVVSKHPDSGTIVKNIRESMSTREMKALRKYLASEGNLGEYWRHGGLE